VEHLLLIDFSPRKVNQQKIADQIIQNFSFLISRYDAEKFSKHNAQFLGQLYRLIANKLGSLDII